MPDGAQWLVFLGSAALVAVLPGPGILYVLARSLRGGRAEGVRSVLGNGVGAMVHVFGSAVGLSALLAASAELFLLVKLLGAAYLVYLGVRALRERADPPAEPAKSEPAKADQAPSDQRPAARGAFRQGVLVEALNPKTAIFFLAFLPHFVDERAAAAPLVFVLLGTVFVLLCMAADLVVAFGAGALSGKLAARPKWWRRQQVASGVTMIGLGGTLAVAE